MNNYWRKKRLELIAGGLHIDRDELARFIGPPASAHFVLHSTGDVTAMYPFNRAKLKADEPATRLADMLDVARAKREAKDYTDDMFARTIKRVQALEDGRDESPLSDYRALARECDFLRIANDQQAKTIYDLQKQYDYVRSCKDQQAKTIGEMQAAAKQREQEKQTIREGRDKAVARCVELEEANKHLYALLGASR